MCKVQCVIDARRVFSARGNEQWWICWHQLPCAMDMFFDQVHNHWICGIKNKNVKWQKKFSGFDFFNMIVQTILQWQFDSFNISISFISHGLDFFHSKRLLVRWKCDKRGKVPQSAPVTPNGDPGPPDAAPAAAQVPRSWEWGENYSRACLRSSGPGVGVHSL